jgi:hypothetical protein
MRMNNATDGVVEDLKLKVVREIPKKAIYS